MTSPENPQETLDVHECVDLLRRNSRGRVALSVDALPTIVPVSYGFVDSGIVMCAGGVTHPLAAVRDTVVAFEVDEVDPHDGAGWSVLVRGLARELDQLDVGELWPSAAPSWFGSDPRPLVSLTVDLISSRRLPSGWIFGGG